MIKPGRGSGTRIKPLVLASAYVAVTSEWACGVCVCVGGMAVTHTYITDIYIIASINLYGGP